MGIVSRVELGESSYWRRAFSDKRKDHRYDELVEDTIRQEFEYLYFPIKDALYAENIEAISKSALALGRDI